MGMDGRDRVAAARGAGTGNAALGPPVGDRPALGLAQVDVDQRPGDRPDVNDRQRFVDRRRLRRLGIPELVYPIYQPPALTPVFVDVPAGHPLLPGLPGPY